MTLNILSKLHYDRAMMEICLIPIFNIPFQYLPCGIIVSEVDEILHEPCVDLTQRQTLFRRLQYRLGNGQ